MSYDEAWNGWGKALDRRIERRHFRGRVGEDGLDGGQLGKDLVDRGLQIVGHLLALSRVAV